jgi:NAD(P)-dependent dehydrogenase (short-subunit alcohol dehydrogenase family)
MGDFGADTTTDEVLDGVDLAGRRIVITGAASGLGFESARAIAAHGASVTVLARSQDRADGAVAQLRQIVAGGSFEAGVVDLGDMASIRAFAEGYLADHDAIDVLINNAGIMACPFGRTADGFETQLGTNHLGHFALTALLAPALLRGDAPRVVTLSSAGHSRSDVDLEDPNFATTEYGEWLAYGRSKTANALFARELATRGGGHGLLSFSVHPGAIMTPLGRHLTEDLMLEMADFARQRAVGTATGGDASPDAPASADPGELLGGMRFKTVEAGAATQVWAATASELADHNGAYLADCGLGVLGGDPGTNGFLPYLLDDDRAAALWTLSEQLTGITFAL